MTDNVTRLNEWWRANAERFPSNADDDPEIFGALALFAGGHPIEMVIRRAPAHLKTLIIGLCRAYKGNNQDEI